MQDPNKRVVEEVSTIQSRPRSAREVLEVLDEFLSNTSTAEMEQSLLWDILAALRGPDHEADKGAKYYTAQIRTRALPKTASHRPFYASFANPADVEESSVLRWGLSEASLASIHFSAHLRSALLALDFISR